LRTSGWALLIFLSLHLCLIWTCRFWNDCTSLVLIKHGDLNIFSPKYPMQICHGVLLISVSWEWQKHH
jgi:hypothetical protein